jgi:hypothetical protein
VLALVLALTLVSIAGCLVDEDDTVEIKYRSTDSFHLLSDGDYYDYIVRGQITVGTTPPSSFEGTMSVTYSDALLPDPFNIGFSVTVLREETVLSLGGFTYTLTRYIDQDANGSIFIIATRAQGNSTLYRTKPTTSLNNIPEPVEILDSNDPMTAGIPLSGTTKIDYQYMPGCEATTPCATAVQRISNLLLDTTTYQGNADVTTNRGRFQAIRIDYTGRFTTITPTILFDIRGACDQNDAVFFSSDYIFPEVGVVFMEHSCTTFGGGGHNYTASLVNTNVSIP